MAEAKITVTYNASEFDIMRYALAEQKAACQAIFAKGSSADPETKSKARARALQLNSMLEKLQ